MSASRLIDVERVRREDDVILLCDLAIEVVWSRRRLDKLEIYRKLGVREVWYWRRGRLSVHALRGEAYEEIPRSEVLPGIDLSELMSFLDRPTASRAIREYRARLQARR